LLRVEASGAPLGLGNSVNWCLGGLSSARATGGSLGLKASCLSSGPRLRKASA